MTQDQSELLTVDAVAAVLGVSGARVRQMVEEGKLPTPLRPGTRSTLWPRHQITTMQEVAAGRQTVPAFLLTPVETPLERVVDEVFEFAGGRSSNFDGGVSRFHVRVWRGPGGKEGSERIVVLIGDLIDTITQTLTVLDLGLADEIDQRLLGGDGHRAAWFVYTTGESPERHLIRSVLLNLDTPQPRRRWPWLTVQTEPDQAHRFGSWSYTGGELPMPLDAYVGEPIEGWPNKVYTAHNVELFTRTRTPVVVEDDYAHLHQLMSAVGILEGSDGGPLAETACQILATEAIHRHTYVEHSGAMGVSDPGWDAPRPWPTVLAGHYLPARFTALERDRVNRYKPEQFDWPEGHDHAEALLPLYEELRAWSGSVDEFSDEPAPDLYDAIQLAADLLAAAMGKASDLVGELTSPPVQLLVFSISKPFDQQYLDQVRWSPTAGSTQRRRRLTALFLREQRDTLRFGIDPAGHLVALEEGSGDDRWWAAEWTTRVSPIPEGAHLVADAKNGDAPAYIEDPEGQLFQLPRVPRAVNGWNHGYGGGGPAALLSALMRALRANQPGPTDPDQDPWRGSFQHYDRLISSPSQQPLRIRLDHRAE